MRPRADEGTSDKKWPPDRQVPGNTLSSPENSERVEQSSGAHLAHVKVPVGALTLGPPKSRKSLRKAGEVLVN